MQFNFFLGNHKAGGLKGMPDLLLPIYHGLAEAGHRVFRYGLNLWTVPTVNVLVEFFPDDEFVERLLAMKADAGRKFVFGVICTEDIEDALVMEQPEFPRRRANLLRVLAAADFVWTLLPQVALYESIAGRSKVALLEYGFTQRFLNRRLVTQPGLRDIDALMYGNPTPYRMPVVDELRRRGFNCFVTDRQVLPDFLTSDLVSRSKVVLDVRRGPGVRFPSPTRICKALHGGALVLAEHLGDSPIANLYNYTASSAYSQLADHCEQIVRSGKYVELGLAALEKFRTETSMAENIRRAMALPIFAELAAAESRP